MNQEILGSRVGFGTASLHHLTGIQRKLSLLDAAFVAGIRYFDTAPLYGYESAERILGQFVRRYQSRDRLVVASKIGLVPNALVGAMPWMLMPYIGLRTLTTRLGLVSPSVWQPRRDYSPTYLVRRVERSLRVMGLDFLDIVYLHEPQLHELRAQDSLLAAVQSLKLRGLVRMFGVSTQCEVAQGLRQQAPELAEVLQVEVSPLLDDAQIKWLALNVAVTFGHFRVLRSELAGLQREQMLRTVASRAVNLNPSGTILFSSITMPHIAEFVSAIEGADQLRRENRHIR